jgi:hypothetical protein
LKHGIISLGDIMGTGIVAAIPIIIGPYKEEWPTTIDPKDFSENFFDNYNFYKKEKVYGIKYDLLIKNYRDFLTEFYTCIDEIEALKNVPNATTYDEFEAGFERRTRNGNVPYLENGSFPFSCLGGECYKYWIFYSGSYKAYLEVYSTLLHFEKLLPKAIKNPLANSVKFAIYG